MFSSSRSPSHSTQLLTPEQRHGNEKDTKKGATNFQRSIYNPQPHFIDSLPPTILSTNLATYPRRTWNIINRLARICQAKLEINQPLPWALIPPLPGLQKYRIGTIQCTDLLLPTRKRGKQLKNPEVTVMEEGKDRRKSCSLMSIVVDWSPSIDVGNEGIG